MASYLRYSLGCIHCFQIRAHLFRFAIAVLHSYHTG